MSLGSVLAGFYCLGDFSSFLPGPQMGKEERDEHLLSTFYVPPNQLWAFPLLVIIITQRDKRCY